MSRLPRHTRPERYTLKLHVDPKKDDYYGEVRIELDTRKGLRSLELHSVDLDLLEIRVEDARGAIDVASHRLNPKAETLSIGLKRPLASNRAELCIGFAGRLRTDLRGLYLARSGRRRYAATQLEATDARRFFPCLDEPDKKARFAISVTTPRENRVVSNWPVARETRKGRNKTVRFAETTLLSTYLVALIVGRLEGSRVRRCGPTPIRVWGVPGKGRLTAFALEAAAESLSRLEKYFGLPYPYPKLDLIAVPDFEFGAMENAGAVTFRESLLFVDPRTVTLQEKKRVAEVMAHELAHMWYGDLVTMSWWDDLWLNEAFATWMAFTVIDDWKPEWQMWLDFDHGRSEALALDGLRNTHPIYVAVETPEQATENFDLITYEKGAAVVRMIERWLGSGPFRRGVRRYIRKHREGNATASDLWRALEQASGTSVEKVVRDWIEKPGHPLVTATRRDRAGITHLILEQERYLASSRARDDERAEAWRIPALIRVGTRGGGRRPIPTLITRRRQSLELGRVADVRWVYANADESGFYRILHDASLLSRLRQDLGRLAPIERMGLISHQWAGVRVGRAGLGEFLDLADALASEPEADVLNRLTGPLAWIRDQLVPRLAEADAIQLRIWLAGRFAPVFSSLGWTPERGEADGVRLRRAALLAIAGAIAGDEEILTQAERRARDYVADRSSLDANLASTTVRLAARRGGPRRYAAYLRVMRGARTPQERSRFEMALAEFRDPALIQRTLDLLLTPTIPTQDVVLVLAQLLSNEAARDTTWRFARDRWEELSPRMTTGLITRFVGALSQLQTRAHRAEVRVFFREHPVPSAARTLKQTLERFDVDAALRRRLTPELRRWLRER